MGLNINDAMRIKLGDSFKHITNTLESRGIDYKIPYKGRGLQSENTDEQSIVLYLEKYGVELNIMNGKVIYIKTSDLKSNTLIDINDTHNTVEVLNAIISKISELFGVTKRDITVETFDGERYNTVLKLKMEETHTVRVSVLCDAHNIAHIHTVRLLVK